MARIWLGHAPNWLRIHAMRRVRTRVLPEVIARSAQELVGDLNPQQAEAVQYRGQALLIAKDLCDLGLSYDLFTRTTTGNHERKLRHEPPDIPFRRLCTDCPVTRYYVIIRKKLCRYAKKSRQ